MLEHIALDQYPSRRRTFLPDLVKPAIAIVHVHCVYLRQVHVLRYSGKRREWGRPQVRTRSNMRYAVMAGDPAAYNERVEDAEELAVRVAHDQAGVSPSTPVAFTDQVQLPPRHVEAPRRGTLLIELYRDHEL